jgi:hypothetical protein
MKVKPLFTVDGFEVYPDRIYTVTNKPSKNAPTGFVKEKTTKIPSLGVGDVFSFRYVNNVWDTGFHEFSPCYVGKDSAEVKKLVKERIDNVLKPFQMSVGDFTAFELTNPESLDKPNFNVEDGMIFTVNDPKARLGLYAALLTKKLTPMEKQHSPEYRNSAFLVEDGTKENKRKNEDAVSFVKAIRVFGDLYVKSPEALQPILTWLKLGNITEGGDEDTMTAIFSEKIKNDKSKIAKFLEISDEIKKESSGHLKYFIYNNLSKMRGKSTDLSTASNGRLYYKGVEIGPDMYTSAENLALNTELQGIRQEILETSRKAVKI